MAKPKFALLGAPGVGKGTFAARISPHFGLPCISTGDLVRAEIKANSALGQQIKSINDKGGLVSDDIIIGMLMKRLANSDCAKGYILDGFPRRVSQAQYLDKHAPLDFVLNIGLDEQVLVTKATHRRVCRSCGHGYNTANICQGDIVMPPLLPKVDGVCDKCKASPLELIQRADDTEAVVRDRLTHYHNETKPLIDFYSAKNNLVSFEVKKGLDDWPALRALLEKEILSRCH